MAELTDVAVEAIDVSTVNSRKDLSAGVEDAGLDDLASSIQEQGLLQPPILRPTTKGRYEVIAGQRRVLAARSLGWKSIPAFVGDYTDTEARTLSLVETVQRAEMSAIDKATAYRALTEEYGSEAIVAKQTGVTTRTIRRYVRLLDLSPELQAQVQTGAGPSGVGFMSRLAEKFNDPDEQADVFDKIKGFKGGLAEEILSRSGGDIGAIDELVDLAIEGQFDRVRCGSSIEECPFIPQHLIPAVRALIEAG